MMTLVNPLIDDAKRDLSVGASAATGFAAGKGIRLGVGMLMDKIVEMVPAIQPYLAMKAVGVSAGDVLAAGATVYGANLASRYVPNQPVFGWQVNGETAKAGAYLAALYPLFLRLVTGAIGNFNAPLAQSLQAKLGYFDDDLGGAWGAIAPINGPEYMKLTGLGEPSQYNTAAVGADIPVDVTPVGIWEHELAGDDLSPAAIAG